MLPALGVSALVKKADYEIPEVNLKVKGLNGNSPNGSPECVVTRRLYRNGDSEYQMNGRTCRLRDIHEMFMDTGLGSKAYSIIEQGKIGQILSTKPADRRAIIEEAAGITKYKTRRRQTQLKLEAAQQNLLRVNDIISEVERQVASLKRQVGKARRYQRLKEQADEAAIQVQVEALLEERNRFIETVFESLGHPFYVVDADDYTIKMANSAGIFQVDELLKKKLKGSGLEQYISIKAVIENEQEKSLLKEFNI